MLCHIRRIQATTIDIGARTFHFTRLIATTPAALEITGGIP